MRGRLAALLVAGSYILMAGLEHHHSKASMLTLPLLQAPGLAVAQEKAGAGKSGIGSGVKIEKSEPGVKSSSGTVKSASAAKLVIVEKSKGKDAEWTFGIDAGTHLIKRGKPVTAADIKPGDSVQVKYTEDGGRTIAQSVIVQAPEKINVKPAGKAAGTPSEKMGSKPAGAGPEGAVGHMPPASRPSTSTGRPGPRGEPEPGPPADTPGVRQPGS